MPREDRRTSDGRFRDGESAALAGVLDVARSHPQYFTALADKDEGDDPQRFEVDLLQDRLRRRDLLASVHPAIEELSVLLSDSEMHIGEKTKSPLLQAYGLAKSVAQHDPTVRATIAAALDYYARIGRRGAETPAAKRQSPPETPSDEGSK
jgi:hypothetical protein